jgi:hypothetical protein
VREGRRLDRIPAAAPFAACSSGTGGRGFGLRGRLFSPAFAGAELGQNVGEWARGLQRNRRDLERVGVLPIARISAPTVSSATCARGSRSTDRELSAGQTSSIAPDGARKTRGDALGRSTCRSCQRAGARTLIRRALPASSQRPSAARSRASGVPRPTCAAACPWAPPPLCLRTPRPACASSPRGARARERAFRVGKPVALDQLAIGEIQAAAAARPALRPGRRPAVPVRVCARSAVPTTPQNATTQELLLESSVNEAPVLGVILEAYCSADPTGAPRAQVFAPSRAKPPARMDQKGFPHLRSVFPELDSTSSVRNRFASMMLRSHASCEVPG